MVWPHMGFKRLMRYVSLRIVRVAHAPKPLARAIACGIAVSFFPIFGVHAFMAFALALVMKASPFAAAAATLVMPPVLLPLLFSLDFLVGRKILHYFGFYGVDDGLMIEKAAAVTRHTTNFEDFVHHFSQFFLPAMIGAVIFMLLTWPAVYMAAHRLIIVLEQRHKRHRAKERAKDVNA